MAGLKELRRRLQSVKNTRKITYAMKLVSAAKLRKAQEAVTRTRGYTAALYALLAEVSPDPGSVSAHPLMKAHEQVSKVKCVVAGGSRGLCGGYNTNVNRRIELFLREQKALGHEVEWVLLGKKPAEYFRRIKRAYFKSYETLPDDPNLWPFEDICQELEHEFLSGAVQEVHLIYTFFKSAISVRPMCKRLFPVETEADGDLPLVSSSGLTLFEPSARSVFEALIPRIVNARMRQSALEARASEQGSRMTAMDSATKNAGELIDKLQMKHNKLRQGSITSQLLDILGGAEALK